MPALPDVAVWYPSGKGNVCICGVGARTPLGLSALASAAAVRGGISAVAHHPRFSGLAGESLSFAADSRLDSAVPLMDRLVDMASSAAADAFDQLPSGVEVEACWVAVPEPRAGLPPDLEEVIGALRAVQPELRGAKMILVPAGHAGGLMAVASAAVAVSRDEIQAALVLGVDSYHDPETLDVLLRHRRLLGPGRPSGFAPGEAAGACLVTSERHAQRSGWPIQGVLRGAATAVEAETLLTDGPCLALGLTASLQAVIGCFESPKAIFTDVYCDLNGERYRSEEYLYALLRTQNAFVEPHAYVSPADCWGDVGSASGPLFVALAVSAARRGYANGSYPLFWTGSDSGYRAALAMALTGREY